MTMNKNPHHYCFLLAGGSGVRLWPFSRNNKPKQFLDFLGMGTTMLQLTYQRIRPLFDDDHVFVLTHQDYYDLVREQLPSIPAENILCEPQRRNTAPAAVWASRYVYQRDKLANVAVLPTDQLVVNETEFRQCLNRGLQFVGAAMRMLTLVVKPTRPDSNYGYIQLADERIGEMFRVKSFTEKPEKEFAKFFVECGEFYWNVGIFLWNVEMMLHSIAEFIPELAIKPDGELPNYSAYSMCPNLSIDYGILERTRNIYGMVCNFGWIDMGTWNQYYEISPKDGDENATSTNDVVLYNCHRNVVKLPEGKVAVIEDLDDYMVIEEDGVMVICPRSKASNIRKYVNDVQSYLGDSYL